MSSHSDSFVKSGNSPTPVSNLPDFLVENHGSVFLVVPLNGFAEAWIDQHIGKHNGYQPVRIWKLG